VSDWRPTAWAGAFPRTTVRPRSAKRSRPGGRPPGASGRRTGRPIRSRWPPGSRSPSAGAAIAEYASRPPAIRLFAESVRAVGAADPSLSVSGIYLAHELYHHLEATGLEPASAQARVTLARLGRWRWESGIPALSEIAAHAFAQALLDLPFFPGALDRFAVRPHPASGAVRGSPLDAETSAP